MLPRNKFPIVSPLCCTARKTYNLLPDIVQVLMPLILIHVDQPAATLLVLLILPHGLYTILTTHLSKFNSFEHNFCEQIKQPTDTWKANLFKSGLKCCHPQKHKHNCTQCQMLVSSMHNSATENKKSKCSNDQMIHTASLTELQAGTTRRQTGTASGSLQRRNAQNYNWVRKTWIRTPNGSIAQSSEQQKSIFPNNEEEL